MSADRQRMRLESPEPLNDDETVGRIESFEATPTTVEFSGVERKITRHFSQWAAGDDDSRLFLSCEDGELSVGYGPEFAPIETNCTTGEAFLAVRTVRAAADGRCADFDLIFDHAGPIVFRSADALAAATPVWLPGTMPRPDRPRCPTGPSIRGGPG